MKDNSLEGYSNKEYYEELSSILDASYDGIHITDGKGKTLFFNEACEKMEGITKEYAIGKNVKEFVEDGIYEESTTLKVLEEKRTISMIQQVNGKQVMVTSTPIFKNGKIIRVVSNSRDMTKLEELKKELKDLKTIQKKEHRELEYLRLMQSEIKNIIAYSSKMKKIINLSLRVSQVDSTVLILGETGVGKGVISKFIHNNSPRKKSPYIKIDCSVIPENLLESELFGYEKGAFTGAKDTGKLGLIEIAEGGTLLLDEIGEMGYSIQSKLLRVLQDRTFLKIGSEKPTSVNIRIIASTNKDLKQMVEKKTFREDLFYRLSVIPINIPPLRERREDIYPIIEKNLKEFNEKFNTNKNITPKALEKLINYDWPGNVRELENIIEQLIVITTDESIDLNDIPEHIRNNNEERIVEKSTNVSSLKDAMEDYEKILLKDAIENSKTIKEAANILNLDYSTARRKLKKYGLTE